ncbi:hypothetical protein ACMHYB_37865 [Sorangium sp. So ce1128]
MLPMRVGVEQREGALEVYPRFGPSACEIQALANLDGRDHPHARIVSALGDSHGAQRQSHRCFMTPAQLVVPP